MFGRAGFDFHWMVGVSVAQQAPQVDGVVPNCAHALVLPPVGDFVPSQALTVQMLGQHENPPRRQRHACEAEAPQEPSDDVAGRAWGHGARALTGSGARALD